MNKITMRVPGYARDLYLNDKREYVIPTKEFETIEELLAVPFVALWASRPVFSQFAKSDSYLMAMCRDNTEAYAVGYIDDDSILESLPNYKDVKVINASVV